MHPQAKLYLILGKYERALYERIRTNGKSIRIKVEDFKWLTEELDKFYAEQERVKKLRESSN